MNPDDELNGYEWLVEHRRLALAWVAGAVGFVSLVLAMIGANGSLVVVDQLSYIATGGLLGLFLLGVAAIAYWAEQRDQELARLTGIEDYLAMMATALGLTESGAKGEGAGEESQLVDA